MRVVLDTSVYVAGILNPNGGSGELLRLWREEAMFEVIASENLFNELLETLRKPKLQGRFEPNDPESAIQSFRQTAERWSDMPNPPSATRDVNDDFLVSLTIRSAAEVLVTLDNDLLVLARLERADGSLVPVVRPGDLLGWLRDSGLR
jgi:putative PIN family toxin of toxin-antitoxin system